MPTVVQVLAAVFFIASAPAASAGSPISGARNGPAIQGYDPVAYFMRKEAVKGVPEHGYEWSGATWHFSSAENKGLFAAEPEKYAPQYGGHCSASVANGKVTPGAGDAWSVHGGKLHLHATSEARTYWIQNYAKSLYWTDREWPKLRDRLLAE